ncbi:MAG: hypothetical protein K2K07_09215 [Lachnospiraceae bacterium]|nr:hypothetical protein [Lachnospiraceae bacterium]
MRKKYLFISIAVILIVVTGILCMRVMTLRNMEPVLSGKEAEETLQNYLIDAGRWSDEYVLNPLSPIKIGNDDAYHFEVRFKDTVEVVGGRLSSNYAITADGNIVFWYDPADDVWIVQE